MALACVLAITVVRLQAGDREVRWYEQEEIVSRLSGFVQSVMEGGRSFSRAPGTGGEYPAGFAVAFPNIRVNQDQSGLSQNETSISVNPLDFANIVGGWNDYRYSGTEDVMAGYGYSRDGGLTWGDGVLPGYTSYDAQGDPALAFDRNGRVFYALIAFDRDYSNSGVYVSVSPDGGGTWGSPVPVNVSGFEAFNDKPYIAVDNTGSPYRGNVYVSWTLFGGNQPIYLSRSTNGGGSFSSPVRVSDSNSAQGSIPAVEPGGDLYVAWFDYSTGNRLRLNVSGDGGVNFGPDQTIQTITPLPGSLYPGFRVNSFPAMAVDGSNGPNRGNLYVCWGDYRHGDADVYFTRSTDGGTSWSTAIRVNDDAVGNDKDQWFPWLSIDASGSIVVIFMDRRNSLSNLYYDVYLARSVDGGLSFEENLRVTTVSSDPRTDFGGTFIGDYNGVASTFDLSYPLWTDTRNGNQDAYTAMVPTGPDNAILDVVLSPDATTIPQGGTLTGEFLISNLTGSPQAFDPLAEVRLPSAGMMVYADPGVLTLPGGGSLSRPISIPVPPHAPVGSYMLKVTLYDPDTGGPLAMDYFSFDITP